MDNKFSNLVIFKRLYGFTLTELLVAMAIASILAVMAAPSFSDMIQRNRAIAQQNDLVSDIMLARMESVKRSRKVSMCSANGDATACSGNNDDWHQGWLIYVNNDGAGVYDSSEDELLRVHDPLQGGNKLKYLASTLTFTSRGFLVSAVNGSFDFCNSNNDIEYAREIIMLQTGRPRRSTGTASTCA